MHLRTVCGARRRQYNTHLTPFIQTTNSRIRKARSYKPKNVEWNNAANEIKKRKKKRKEEGKNLRGTVKDIKLIRIIKHWFF